ncbi:hypothetical protein ACFL3C_01825 [Patescibacteria group bacterium]
MPHKRKYSLNLVIFFSLVIGIFLEFALFQLGAVRYTLYWELGVGFYFLVVMFVLAIYGPHFLHIEKDYQMGHAWMRAKRILHYVLHYFLLPTFLYFSTLTSLFFLSSAILQHILIALSTFAFFSILICVSKVVKCAPVGYNLPETKKMLYYYICRLKFCFFYKLYVAFLAFTSLYILSIELVIPQLALPFAIGVAMYLLLTHNMLFTVNWSWKVQKRALVISLLMAVLAFVIRLGKVHFIISGTVLITFYHIFEGFYFHKLSKLSKDILHKYLLMGAIAVMIVWGSFDLDLAGLVQLPDENFARIGGASITEGTEEGGMFAIGAAFSAIVFFFAYITMFQRVIKTQAEIMEEKKDRLFIFKD